MDLIDNTYHATQLIKALNDGFIGNGAQEIFLSDNATALIEKINSNFEAIDSSDRVVFPPNTILPVDIGSLNANEDIGGMTIDQFVTFGINGATREFTILHASDPHTTAATTNKAKELLDEDSSIKAFILTGDIQVAIGSTLSNSMLACGSKLLAVFGNHDLSDVAHYNGVAARTTMATWLGDNVTFGSQQSYGSYWHKDYQLGAGKLRILGLDQYNYPGDYSGTASGYPTAFTQEQIDWFVSKLKELEAGDYFLIALHEPPIKGGNNPATLRRYNSFCSSRLFDWAARSSNANFIPSIVNAYTHKLPIAAGLEDFNLFVSVEEDFSSVSSAKFLGYLCGHIHTDYIGWHPVYPDQLVMTVDCALSNTYGLGSDIRSTDDLSNNSPRQTAILLNKLTFDVAKGTVRIERIGENQACAHVVNKSNTFDTDDPHENGYEYEAITRTAITI